MLAPHTREHWIPWRMRLHGWSLDRAEAEYLLYEIRMNEKAEGDTSMSKPKQKPRNPKPIRPTRPGY